MFCLKGDEGMSKIIGVGGIFLDFRGEKDVLHSWYSRVLGMDMTDYGTGFLEGNQMMLVSFKRDSDASPIINFRVEGIEGISDKLKDESLDVKEIIEYEYGKFMHFIDPFGNLIELWEPYEEPYLKMVKQEIDNYLEKKSKESSDDSHEHKV